MAIPWTRIAATAYQMGKLLITGRELTEQVNDLLKDRRRALDSQEAIQARIQQLEEALAKQVELHQQYQTQIELMRSALEDIRKSLRIVIIVAALSVLLGLTAALVALFK